MAEPLEPRYVKVYCRTAAQLEQARAKMGHEWGTRNKRTLGLSLAEKVEGHWRCQCCGKAVRVVW